MVESTEGTDTGIGLTLALVVLALIGAAVMLATADGHGQAAGWGFAAAITFATLAVVAIHLDWRS